jgi:hypothetical protein
MLGPRRARLVLPQRIGDLLVGKLRSLNVLSPVIEDLEALP